MGLQVDPRIRECCDKATAHLRDAADHAAFMKQRTRSVEGGTRTTVGVGLPEGDKLLSDLARTSSCLDRAQAAIQRAVAEIGLVDRMVLVDEGENGRY